MTAMTTEMTPEQKKPTLAQRREALQQECSEQRTKMQREIDTIRAPKLIGGGIVESLGEGRFKKPVTIATLAVSFLATRRVPGMKTLAGVLTAVRLVQSVLATIRTKPS